MTSSLLSFAAPYEPGLLAPLRQLPGPRFIAACLHLACLPASIPAQTAIQQTLDFVQLQPADLPLAKACYDFIWSKFQPQQRTRAAQMLLELISTSSIDFSEEEKKTIPDFQIPFWLISPFLCQQGWQDECGPVLAAFLASWYHSHGGGGAIELPRKLWTNEVADMRFIHWPTDPPTPLAKLLTHSQGHEMRVLVEGFIFPQLASFCHTHLVPAAAVPRRSEAGQLYALLLECLVTLPPEVVDLIVQLTVGSECMVNEMRLVLTREERVKDVDAYEYDGDDGATTLVLNSGKGGAIRFPRDFKEQPRLVVDEAKEQKRRHLPLRLCLQHIFQVIPMEDNAHATVSSRDADLDFCPSSSDDDDEKRISIYIYSSEVVVAEDDGVVLLTPLHELTFASWPAEARVCYIFLSMQQVVVLAGDTGNIWHSRWSGQIAGTKEAVALQPVPVSEEWKQVWTREESENNDERVHRVEGVVNLHRDELFILLLMKERILSICRIANPDRRASLCASALEAGCSIHFKTEEEDQEELPPEDDEDERQPKRARVMIEGGVDGDSGDAAPGC